jgi:hypothetical protein
MNRRRIVLSTLLLSVLADGQRAHSMQSRMAADLPAPFRKMVFKGTVDRRKQFTMFLDADPRRVHGACRFADGSRHLQLRGAVSSDGSVTFDVYEQRYGSDGSLSKTGRITGALAGDRLTGNWQSFGPERLLPFNAIETKPRPLSSAATKREALSQAVGRFRLVAISGHCCGSNDYSAQRSDRGWQYGGSSIVGGERTGYITRLGRDDVARLNSIEVIVAPDLTVQLFAGKRRLLEVPFTESGMLLDAVQPEGGPYTPSTTFLEEYEGAPVLVLGLVSGQDWSTHVALRQFPITTQGKARLVLPQRSGFFYGDEFELTIDSEDAGPVDRTTLTFGKH